jgi:PPOX class probable F420-dependent enzyme
MKEMTQNQWHAFLLTGTKTAKLATVRADGRPHVAPIWYDLDGNDLIFMTGKGTVKGKNILRDPRVMLSIDDEEPPFAFVLIEGVAVASDVEPAELLPWSTRIAKRYMGAEKADAYGKRNAVIGELLVRVPMTKVIAQNDVAD